MRFDEYDIECLELAKSIITNRPDDHITISYLSSKVGMNSKKLKYGFKFKYGITIHDFQVKLRMTRATALLMKKNILIKEIATQTGYKTISSFSIAFRKEYHKPPSKWRENAG